MERSSALSTEVHALSEVSSKTHHGVVRLHCTWSGFFFQSIYYCQSWWAPNSKTNPLFLLFFIHDGDPKLKVVLIL